jgi:P pilus assembly chaperone PapD
MNTTSNTRLRLNYTSWSRPRSHWSATNPRNQQKTFRAKTQQHTQRKFAWLAAYDTPVRPMACADQTGGQSRTINVPESLSYFSRPWNQNTPKTQPAWKENHTQNLARQHQTDQELTSNNPTKRHMDLAAHKRQIPQRVHTGQTGQEHRSDRCNLGSSG